MSGAIPYFGDAYMADTRHLTLEEHGAYHLLLLIAWRSPNCALPNDDKRIAQMLGITPKKWAALKPTVLSFWTLTEHGWEQKRLTKERRWVEEKKAKNKAAAEARWDANSLKDKGEGDANASANAQTVGDANGYAPPPPPHKKEKAEAIASGKKVDPRGERLPDDWAPKPLTGKTAEMVAVWPAGMIERELAKFRDHYRKTPGARGRSLDWDASYRNWLRIADERRPTAHGRTDSMGRHQPSDGLSSTARAALQVFGR